ncbi:hypothetical protein QQ73_19300, partial [Candidatus Endoriftia persephone str. Guaymas]|nr:hypothetical protein [Candidatus Endoriftia persephone str. Guaymas]
LTGSLRQGVAGWFPKLIISNGVAKECIQGCYRGCYRMVLLLTFVKAVEAVDHDRQGMRAIGFGQFVAASDAIWRRTNHKSEIKIERAICTCTIRYMA